MKKFLTLLLFLCLILSACGGEINTPKPTETTPPALQETGGTTEQATPGPSPQETGRNQTGFGDHAADFYDRATGITYTTRVISNYVDGNTSYYFCKARSEGSPYWLAVKEINGYIESYFILLDTTGKTLFTDGNYYNRLSQNGVMAVRDKVNELYCYVDYNRQTITFEDAPYDKREDYHEIASKNGYTLYQGDYSGGGDVSYHDIILYEDATGKNKVLDNIGGMYGGLCGAGFFQNGDVYVIDTDGFKVFSTDMAETGHRFMLGDKFPFGDDINSEIALRYLLAARRDPVDFSYIAVYMEMPHYRDYYDKFVAGSEDSQKLKATYKVGCFDPQGNLIKSIDTGENVDWSAFGIQPVYMYKTDENTVEFYSRFKTVYVNDIISVNTATEKVNVTRTIASSPDGRYLLYYENRRDGDTRHIILRDKNTGKEIFIGDEYYRHVKSAGFLEDNNIYVLSAYDYRVYNTDGEIIKVLGNDTFDFGKNISPEIDGRYLAAVLHSYTGMPKAALYYEYPAGYEFCNINDYQSGIYYKIALFDKNGNLKKTINTDLKAFITGKVRISDYNGDKMFFEVTRNYRAITRGRFDMSTGRYTPNDPSEWLNKNML